MLSDASTFNTPAGHSVMAMSTSQANPPWALDCPLSDLSSAGLPAAFKVRFKLFTLDHRMVRGEIGKLSVADAAAICQGLEHLFGASGPYHAVDPAV